MNILLLGAHGQLGKKMIDCKPDGVRLLSNARQDLDITDTDKIRLLISNESIKVVINCAAYTQVDKAESDQENAFKINSDAVGKLAEVCKKESVFLVYFSTDYVFSGEGRIPYLETSTPGPINVYGKSKLEGENGIIRSGCNFAIIRTTWVYAEYGKNFFRTMASRFLADSAVRVVNDQFGAPTYAGDLARATWSIVGAVSEQINFKEILNFTNEGVTTWYEFACAIADGLGKTNLVTGIKTTEYPTPAKRPAYSVLDKSKIKAFFKIEVRPWEAGLSECFEKYRKLEGI